ncbi:MAG TPA: MBL fold metallo-hydrolase RNA specificity domain-containing protein [Bryobacteraceae bacterium]|nr:MBL fold metallo-hydrolase RNA specificity domain-containing protein [Bryobacteraceae bacterium]
MRIEFTPAGIYLPAIGLWLDPAEQRDAAWISHAHGDHARALHRTAIATPETLEAYAIRFPEAENLRALAFGESLEFRGARLTPFPAGHIPGAAQLLIEFEGERIVSTGDFKLRTPLLGPQAVTVPCDRLIMESTFGLPIFHFLSREEARERICAFARECFDWNLTPVFLVHPLGRGQEVLHVLCEAGIPTAVHGAVARFLPLYESRGTGFPGWTPYESLDTLNGKALVAVHGFRRRIEASGRNFRTAYVSGWAALDNARARAGAEELIPYSDHADFNELLSFVEAAAPREIDIVHGYAEPFARILNSRGWKARAQTAPFGRAAAIREADE